MPDRALVLRKREELAPTAQPSVQAPFWVAAPKSVVLELSALAAAVTSISSTFWPVVSPRPANAMRQAPSHSEVGGGGGGGRLFFGTCSGTVGVGDGPFVGGYGGGGGVRRGGCGALTSTPPCAQRIGQLPAADHGTAAATAMDPRGKCQQHLQPAAAGTAPAVVAAAAISCAAKRVPRNAPRFGTPARRPPSGTSARSSPSATARSCSWIRRRPEVHRPPSTTRSP